MIILDTNVISALMRDTPDRSVVAWLNRQPMASVWTSSVTVFEVRFGLALLPHGRARSRLQEAFETILEQDLEDRVLSFDAQAATAAALIAADRRRAGRPVEIRDTQIAGIAAAHRATIATRNLRHFEDLDLSVVNPWN
ncbi:MAG: type II toxin-antitoxin system VapC family toxin [Proteobacteria bacterium]|nr:type II toxin-antitoxin system VapC family toxin [Pseudomonadota bacterium]MBI3499131.1 type II toxin-antitoxin system VapC family toxin [Pseudomonadota bacterium]